MKQEFKVAEDVAIKDVKDFVDEINDTDLDLEEVKEKYPKILKAVMLGLLVLGDEPLTYELREPIKNPAGETTVTELTIRTRILPDNQKSLVKGLNMKTDKFEFGLRSMAYIIGQPVAMLSKFGRNDYKLIEELTELFL